MLWITVKRRSKHSKDESVWGGGAAQEKFCIATPFRFSENAGDALFAKLWVDVCQEYSLDLLIT